MLIITSIHNLNLVSALWHLSGERWPFGEQSWRLPRVTLSDQSGELVVTLLKQDHRLLDFLNLRVGFFDELPENHSVITK